MKKFKNKAVFLDRDGIINQLIKDNKKNRSPRTLDELKINLKIKKYLKIFKKKSFLNIIITNQPEVKRGFVQKKVIIQFHKKIMRLLPIDKIYVCYDTNDKSFFRKPNPGMLLQASKELNIDLKKSYFIGDRNKDIYAGNKVKCKTIFIDFNYNERKPKKFFLCSKSLVKGFNLLNKDISEILKKHKKKLN